ncbi:MAG: biotin--[acetyl-CoA-carboxylase] ligase, partial [Sulfurimonas sp.]
MKILSLECVDSTQTYVLEGLKSGRLHAPVAVVASEQTRGRGSRDNHWISLKGNLFFSFAVARDTLPDDLKLESSSIYFSMLLKEVLLAQGSHVWLKWPNDFYLEEQKIGGTITTLHNDIVICGIGLNMAAAPQKSKTLDVSIKKSDILTPYFTLLKSSPSWKQIFSK